MSNNTNYRFAFIMVAALFFMWSCVYNLDPILIPHLKKSFSLSVLQSSLVDSAVFIAYFIMALLAGFIIRKIGYKRCGMGFILGKAIGTFLMKYIQPPRLLTLYSLINILLSVIAMARFG